MRKLFPILLSAVILSFVSCSNNDDRFYISTSGDGSVVVDYDSPAYLYRMVLFTSDTQQEIYLMGNSAYVDSDAAFNGRGAVVKIVVPNSDENTTLQAQSFDIGTSDYSVSYSRYISYSSGEGDSDLLEVDSGTVIIRRSGSFYDLRLLGSDVDDNNVLIAYRGYIYRSFLESSDLR